MKPYMYMYIYCVLACVCVCVSERRRTRMRTCLSLSLSLLCAQKERTSAWSVDAFSPYVGEFACVESIGDSD